MGSGRLTAVAALCLLALFAVRLPGLTDNTASAEKKKTILQHADSVEGGETPESSGKVAPFRSAVGNVVFVQDKMVLKCDRATEYPEGNKINIDGNIFIKENTVESYGDHGVYYPAEETGELSGNVRGRVVEDGLVGKAQKSVFNIKTNELWLYSDAIAWHRGRQLSGDIIRIHLREVNGKKQADEIQVHGHAFFAAKDTLSTRRQLFDQLSGQHMVITLDKRSRLTGITVTTKARSLYHIYDKENQPSSVNFTSGEVIRMFFSDGKLSRILVTDNPQGKEYPNRMREDKAIDLPDFRWREEEMPTFR
jgi:lipopolysaccharide export system protein LptA